MTVGYNFSPAVPVFGRTKFDITDRGAHYDGVKYDSMQEIK